MKNKINSTYEINEAGNFIKKFLEDNPSATNVELTTALTDRDTALTNTRLKEVLTRVNSQYSLEPAKPAYGSLSVPVIGDAGTGYLRGQTVGVDGDGTGAFAEILSVDPATGAVIDFKLVNAGKDYTSATIDMTGFGDGLATATVALAPARESEVDAVNLAIASL